MRGEEYDLVVILVKESDMVLLGICVDKLCTDLVP